MEEFLYAIIWSQSGRIDPMWRGLDGTQSDTHLVGRSTKREGFDKITNPGLIQAYLGARQYAFFHLTDR